MAGPEVGFEHFAHGADIGVRGRGRSLAEAFAQAARALTAVMVDPDKVEPRIAVPVSVEAPDPEILLVDWLNALVLETATRRLLLGRFEVAIDDGRLQATAWGEPIDPERHAPAVEVKGATMTELVVRRGEDGRWLAQCVVDV